MDLPNPASRPPKLTTLIVHQYVPTVTYLHTYLGTVRQPTSQPIC